MSFLSDGSVHHRDRNLVLTPKSIGPCLNGPTWTSRAFNSAFGNAVNSCAFLNNVLVFVGGSSGNWVAKHSLDFDNAIDSTFPGGVILNTDSPQIAASPSALVCYANAISFMRTTNGVNWSQIAVTSRSDRNKPWFSNDRFWCPYVTGGPGIDVSSDNGLTYASIAVPFTPNHGAGNANRVVIIGNTQAAYSDNNGANWVAASVPTEWSASGRPPMNVFWTGSEFIGLRNSSIGGIDDIIYNSDDGSVWIANPMGLGFMSWNDATVLRGVTSVYGGSPVTPGLSLDGGNTWAFGPNAPPFSINSVTTNGQRFYAGTNLLTPGSWARGVC